MNDKPPCNSVRFSIREAPLKLPAYSGKQLLVTSICAAKAYELFDQDFLSGWVLLVDCNKGNKLDFTDKLTAILNGNDFSGLTVLRRVELCHGEIERAAKQAAAKSERPLTLRELTIDQNGHLLN